MQKKYRIINTLMLLMVTMLLSGCSDSGNKQAVEEKQIESSSTVEKQKLDVSNIKIPESVIDLVSKTPDISKPADQLFVETGTYYDGGKDVEKPIINILQNDENGDSMTAVLDENGNVEKYILRGDNLEEILSVVDTLEGQEAAAAELVSDMSEAMNKNESLDKAYDSESYDYFLQYNPSAKYPLKGFTITINPK